MLILKQSEVINSYIKALKKSGKTIGFVPTMGALHKGHISLIQASKRKCDVTVCSIFVNPTQFNDKSDFEKYPITIDKDIQNLCDAGCNILFLPSVEEMYPNGFTQKAKIDFGFIAKTLEGEYRPGHFDGVAQVVEMLLRIVNPDFLFMGQKDYQQQLVIKQLIIKRRFRTELVCCPTLREKDGLAMSSRNVRLDTMSRKLAAEISKTLKKVKSEIRNQKSEISNLESWGINRLASIQEISPEYFEIRNAATLKPVKQKSEKLVALTAVQIGGVRLIDNMLLN